jgi:hypothetical protein
MNPPIETANPPHVALVLKHNRRRRGRVACLSEDLRNLVNIALDNGRTYAQIAEQLHANGHTAVTMKNIGKWARGGYRDYVREKQRNTLLREHTNKVLSVAASLDDKGRLGYEKVSANLIAARVLDTLQNFDPDRLDGLLGQKPEMFFRLARIANAQSLDLSRARRVELAFQKYRDNVEEQKRKMEAALKPKTAEGLTKEQIAEIHEAMRLL